MKYSIPYISLCLLITLRASGQVTVEDVDANSLRDTFNSLKDKTRILTIYDPLCGPCKASRDDFREEIFKKCNNEELAGLFVWVQTPSFPNGKRSDAVTQAQLLNDPRVRHFWNTPTDDIPKSFAALAGVSTSYAWDIDFLYAAGIEWTDTIPPEPTYCMAKIFACNPYSISAFKSEIETLEACTAVLSVKPLPGNVMIDVFPNPSSGALRVRLSQAGFGLVTLRLVNVLGVEVRRVEVWPGEGDLTMPLDVVGLSNGMYVLHCAMPSGSMQRAVHLF